LAEIILPAWGLAVKLLLAAFVIVVLATSGAFSQMTPVPRGIRQADQAEAQTQQNIPPPKLPLAARVDLAKLTHDADELSRLALTIPSDLVSIEKGMLPKDTTEKLKQIEKLSKHLRGELNQ
jgi:hypothetical protein